MTNFSSQFSRRKFLLTAGASAASSILLKGCLGNPPEPGNTTTTQANAAQQNRGLACPPCRSNARNENR